MKSKFTMAVMAMLLVAFASTAMAEETNWTTVEVKEIHCAGCAKKIAARIYAVKGVKEVRANVKKNTLIIAPTAGTTFSPAAIWVAIEKSKNVPLRLAGPSGTFTTKPTF